MVNIIWLILIIGGFLYLSSPAAGADHPGGPQQRKTCGGTGNRAYRNIFSLAGTYEGC